MRNADLVARGLTGVGRQNDEALKNEFETISLIAIEGTLTDDLLLANITHTCTLMRSQNCRYTLTGG